MKNKELKNIQEKLEAFATERDWNKFHSPKNLVMALSSEVGELSELFQWLTEDESHLLTDKQRRQVEAEIADVFLYTLRLCSVLKVDLLKASLDKIEDNHKKYPVDKCFGISKKYDQL